MTSTAATSDVGTVVIDSQRMVTHQVFDESLETPTSISNATIDNRQQIFDIGTEIWRLIEKKDEHLADASKILKEMASNKVNQPSLTPNSVSIVDNLEDSEVDVIIVRELDNEVGKSPSIREIEIEMTVEDVGGQIILDWVHVLGGTTVFKGSRDASDEGEGVMSKGEVDDVEKNYSDDNMCLFGSAMKVFDEIPNRVVVLEAPLLIPQGMNPIIYSLHQYRNDLKICGDMVKVYKLHENEYGKTYDYMLGNKLGLNDLRSIKLINSSTTFKSIRGTQGTLVTMLFGVLDESVIKRGCRLLDASIGYLCWENEIICYEFHEDERGKVLPGVCSNILVLEIGNKVFLMLSTSVSAQFCTCTSVSAHLRHDNLVFGQSVVVIQSCSKELEPSICGFLTSRILDINVVGNELIESYHEIIFEIFRCAPQMLLVVIPILNHELLTDQVDVRIKSINLIRRFFVLPGCHVAQEYRHVFVEFLNRISDKSFEVRISVLACAKYFYMPHPSIKELEEILIVAEERLLDFDDKVRAQVVSDLAKYNHKPFPPNVISEAAKRFHEKRVSVRRRTLQKLLPIYHNYCAKCSGGLISLSDHLEAIPCGILMLYYDKDCKDFRPLNVEHMLAEDLFPASLSVEERTRHRIFFILLRTIFIASHEKALNFILSQKHRLQTELKLYLVLRRNEEEIGSEEMKRRKNFMKMSKFFLDPSKEGECFDVLDKMNDCVNFNKLEELLDEVTIESGQALIDNLVTDFGDQHSNSEFLQQL